MAQQGVRAMVAAGWRQQQLLAGMLVLVLIATLTAAGGAAADEVPAVFDTRGAYRKRGIDAANVTAL